MHTRRKNRHLYYNGLLLCPNHDKLFDLGYISFDEHENILISHLLNQNNQIFLSINHQMKIKLNEQNQPYLTYHRNHIFQK